MDPWIHTSWIRILVYAEPRCKLIPAGLILHDESQIAYEVMSLTVMPGPGSLDPAAPSAYLLGQLPLAFRQLPVPALNVTSSCPHPLLRKSWLAQCDLAYIVSEREADITRKHC